MEGLFTSKHDADGKKANHVGNPGERERKAELMAKHRGNTKRRKEKEQRKRLVSLTSQGKQRSRKFFPLGLSSLAGLSHCLLSAQPLVPKSAKGVIVNIIIIIIL